MSTPQWFAEFERQEAMRQDRLDQIKADAEKWRMGYDHWKTTNPADEWLGPEPLTEKQEALLAAEQEADMEEMDRLRRREERRKVLEEAARLCDLVTWEGPWRAAAHELGQRIRALTDREPT